MKKKTTAQQHQNMINFCKEFRELLEKHSEIELDIFSGLDGLIEFHMREVEGSYGVGEYFRGLSKKALIEHLKEVEDQI